MHGKKSSILLKWTDFNFYQRKESCHKTVDVREQQQQKNEKMRSENMSMHIEIVFIGNIKKKFCVSAEERETISYFGIVIFWLGGKTCTEKTK